MRLAALPRALVWLLCSVSGIAALAQEASADDTEVAVLSSVAPPRTTRMDLDTTAQPESRLTPPGVRAEWSALSYRWWLTRGRTDLGLGLGTVGYVARPAVGEPVAGPATAGSFVASAPLVTIGMRYRTSELSVLFADVSGARNSALNRGGDAYFTKVGVEWKASPSRFNLTHGGLGLQLDGGSRMSLRLRKGVLGLYLRSQF